MRIYREIDEYRDTYYFMTSRENGLFKFSLALPDRNSLVLHSCTLYAKEGEDIYDNSTIVSDDIYKRFNRLFDKKGNYDGICSILMEVFDGVDQNSLNKSFRRNDEALDLTDKCIKKCKRKVADYHYEELAREVEYYMRIWDNDNDRIIRWMVAEVIPDKMTLLRPMIDVYGTTHPTEDKLLHRFYSHWGDTLDSIIKQCIEEYPDENDFDLATYRCEELLFGDKENKESE